MASETASAAFPTAAPLKTSQRRFTLLDAMILLAGLALGLMVLRWIDAENDEIILWSFSREAWSKENIKQPLFVLFLMIPPIVAGLTLALIPIRLLGPRPRLRRLACQPGFMASVTAASTLVFVCLPAATVLSVTGQAVGQDVILESFPFLVVIVGLAVVASWMTLMLGRRWRAEPSWIDRFGRIMGLFWIVAGMAGPGAISWIMS